MIPVYILCIKFLLWSLIALVSSAPCKTWVMTTGVCFEPTFASLVMSWPAFAVWILVTPEGTLSISGGSPHLPSLQVVTPADVLSFHIGQTNCKMKFSPQEVQNIDRNNCWKYFSIFNLFTNNLINMYFKCHICTSIFFELSDNGYNV